MRIQKLDGLRGIFSIMVVFYHYSEDILPGFIFNNFFIRQSYTFVDFFFVLSGFVIAYNYNVINTPTDLYNFLKKRLIRLYPLLFFTTVIYAIFLLVSHNLLPEYSGKPDVFSDLWPAFIDNICLTNSTPILGLTAGTNYPSWSISSEIISYFVYGVVAFCFVGKKRIFSFSLIVLISSLFLIWHKSYFSIVDYGFVRGLICFNFGYFIWLLSKEKRIVINNYVEFLIPALLLIIFYLLNSFYEHSFKQEIIGLLLIPVFFSFSILTFIKTNGKISKLLETKVFQFLGKISYSIYLNHALVIAVVPKLIFNKLELSKTNLNEIIVLFFTIGLIIIYSFFTYKYIEKLFSKLLNKLWLKKDAVV